MKRGASQIPNGTLDHVAIAGTDPVVYTHVDLVHLTSVEASTPDFTQATGPWTTFGNMNVAIAGRDQIIVGIPRVDVPTDVGWTQCYVDLHRFARSGGTVAYVDSTTVNFAKPGGSPLNFDEHSDVSGQDMWTGIFKGNVPEGWDQDPDGVATTATGWFHYTFDVASTTHSGQLLTYEISWTAVVGGSLTASVTDMDVADHNHDSDPWSGSSAGFNESSIGAVGFPDLSFGHAGYSIVRSEPQILEFYDGTSQATISPPTANVSGNEFVIGSTPYYITREGSAVLSTADTTSKFVVRFMELREVSSDGAGTPLTDAPVWYMEVWRRDVDSHSVVVSPPIGLSPLAVALSGSYHMIPV